MESKGGKKKSSSKSLFYEAPLGYSIEDIRPNGGIKKFRSAAYSNVSFSSCCRHLRLEAIIFRIKTSFGDTMKYGSNNTYICFHVYVVQCARKPS
ncbi:hypothetical protein L484_026543 [Morus notabilis]|uniref:S-adenosylmethionine decarboxylase proenzyme n=1 Tax=Morus notabilis TaxID=981085 RepID=W9QZ47_9ROSA|nr:hypothetical protein L484_026543 [Morus notabilis]